MEPVHHDDAAPDVEHVLYIGGATDGEQPTTPGSLVRHLHRHGDAVAVQQNHWADVVGIARTVAGPRVGFADRSLGGTCPHRTAVHTGRRPGAPPAPEGTVGMRDAVTRWASADAMGAAVARLDTMGRMVGESPDGIMATDGFGSRVTMRGARAIGGIAVGRARYGHAPR